MRMPKFPVTGPSTPVGAATQAACLAQVIIYLATLWWPWFAALPSGIVLAITTIVTGIVAYLGGWLRVVTTPGQALTTTLTASALPTLQATPAEPDPPATPA
jgi:hypothetical protein